ncbi:Hat1_N domain-containing protein [Haematococcus lacustris]|uniref:Hat1_N domain-containing protein n=1 Tax=Haematococcus lacustris TaxID=44745 RepID=A0A699Y8C7_HAELA|nr:Hat1_N domain-containing protein [Haematococcus lacustris]
MGISNKKAKPDEDSAPDAAQTYHTWIDIKYKQKKLGADKIDKVLRKHFPSGYASSKDEFIKLVTSTVQGAGTGSASDKLDVQAAGDTLGTVALAGSSQMATALVSC